MLIRKKKSEHLDGIFNVDRYWNMVALEVPELFAIYRVLRASCATEASCERMFSSEAAIHDDLRNSLSVKTMESVMKIRWNVEPVKALAVRTSNVRDSVFIDEIVIRVGVITSTLSQIPFPSDLSVALRFFFSPSSHYF